MLLEAMVGRSEGGLNKGALNNGSLRQHGTFSNNGDGYANGSLNSRREGEPAEGGGGAGVLGAVQDTLALHVDCGLDHEDERSGDEGAGITSFSRRELRKVVAPPYGATSTLGDVRY
eukprot:2230064-Rhodomonas_salina.1